MKLNNLYILNWCYFLQVSNDDEEFRITLDVSSYSPEEITVKTKNSRIVVHAKHEEREDEFGFVEREFKRKYILPKVTFCISLPLSCQTSNYAVTTSPVSSYYTKQVHVYIRISAFLLTVVTVLKKVRSEKARAFIYRVNILIRVQSCLKTRERVMVKSAIIRTEFQSFHDRNLNCWRVFITYHASNNHCQTKWQS